MAGIVSAEKAKQQGGLHEQRVRALGVALNALASQARAMTAHAAASFHAELPPAAFHIALWLSAFGPATPSAVAQAVGMDRSATSRLTRDLARVGLIETQSESADRRSVTLFLTPEGRRRVDEAMQGKGAVFQERVASWSEDDLLLCTALLQRLVEPA